MRAIVTGIGRPMGGRAAGDQIPASAWYYQALALEKLGQPSHAQALYQQLLSTGTSQIADAGSSVEDSTASYVPAETRSCLGDAYYLAALGYLGLNETEKARHELTEALRVSPDYLMAKVAVESQAH